MTINEQLDNNNIDIVFTEKMNMTVTDIVQGQYTSQKDLQVEDAFKFDLNSQKDGEPVISLFITEGSQKDITSNFSSGNKFVQIMISQDGEITLVINGNEVFNVTDAGAVNVTNEVYDVDKQQTLDNAVMILEADGLTNLANLIRNN